MVRWLDAPPAPRGRTVNDAPSMCAVRSTTAIHLLPPDDGKRRENEEPISPCSWNAQDETGGMEPDDLLYSRNARPRKALVGRAQWKINQPPSLKKQRARWEGLFREGEEKGRDHDIFIRIRLVLIFASALVPIRENFRLMSLLRATHC